MLSRLRNASSELFLYNFLVNRSQSWKMRFKKEMQRAETARAEGNEGMARVCARRAAGIVAKEYFKRREIGLPRSTIATLQSLKVLSQLPDVPEEVREVAAHFTVNITPDHVLPGDVDLLAEVLWLEERLLGEGR